jgi:hypothetical protein
MITLEVKGIKEMNDMFTKLGELSEQYLQDAITSTAMEASGEMSQLCPVKTGRLRSSIHYETPSKKEFVKNIKQGSFNLKFKVKLDKLQAAWGTNVEYANDVNYGTRPHIIRPVNKKALFWKGANHPVKSVKHPGTKGNGMFEASYSFAQGRLEYFLKKNLDKAMKEAKK